MEFGRDGTDGGFDERFARVDAPEISESLNNSDGAVPTHAQIAYVIKEDHSGSSGGILRLAEESAYDYV